MIKEGRVGRLPLAGTQFYMHNTSSQHGAIILVLLTLVSFPRDPSKCFPRDSAVTAHMMRSVAAGKLTEHAQVTTPLVQ